MRRPCRSDWRTLRVDGLRRRRSLVRAPFFVRKRSVNPTAGSHSRSLIQVKIHSPNERCLKQQSRRRVGANGFALSPIRVPCHPRGHTASLGVGIDKHGAVLLDPDKQVYAQHSRA